MVASGWEIGKRQFLACQKVRRLGANNVCLKTRGRPSLAKTRMDPEDKPKEHAAHEAHEDHLEGQAQ